MANPSNRFRIAFYCSSLSWGGLEMNTLRHAIWMKERGHEVILVCVENTPLWKASFDSNISIRLVKRNKKNFDFSAAFRLKKLLKSDKIDIVWFRDKRDLSTIGMAKTFSFNRIKILYHQAMQIGVNKKHLIHTIRFRKIDAWISPLNYLKDQIATKTNYHLNKVHVIPLAIDKEAFRKNGLSRDKGRELFGFTEEDKVVGIIGRIDPHKAQQFVKDATVELSQNYPNLKLLIVGNKTEGEWEQYYQALATDKDVSKDEMVKLRPFMKDVATFYNCVDVFVMSSAKETFGMVTIEAMMSGKVILGSNTCGTLELLNDAKFGYYFVPNNKDTYQEALTSALDSWDEALQKAESAKSYAELNFDHHTECSRIEKVLEMM